MKKESSRPADATELRRRAEEHLKHRSPERGNRHTEVEMVRLNHELQVHQIELEMQNEELRQARTAQEALLVEYTDLYDSAPVGYMTLDRRESILRVNLTGALQLGVQRARLVNRHFGQFVAERDRPAFADFLTRVFASDAPEACEVALRHEGAAPRVAAIRGARSPNGLECRMVVVDVSARRRAEAERAVLAKAVERKNRELEILLHVISRGLRDPLLSLQGFTESLQQAGEVFRAAAALPEWDAKTRREVTETGTERVPMAQAFLRSNLEKMHRLIDGLSRLSRFGATEPQPERLDLDRMVSSIRDALAYQIHAAGAVVEVGPLPPCEGDATMINQLFTNLLENALLSPKAGRPLEVRLTGKRENGRSVYCVSDNGAGIPVDDLKDVWNLFHQVNPMNPTTSTSLGLYLVRRIVERHDGDVRIESRVGEGSRLIVSLPAPDAAVGRGMRQGTAPAT